jgi:hypothetical protein
MPPRYSYWTIIAGGLPTAFRAAERDDLLPTFKRIQEKHADAEMKWFARGKLWESPEAARADTEARRLPPAGHRPPADRRPPGERRGRDWRPGGEHRDPRQKFIDAMKDRNQDRRKQRFERKQGVPRRPREDAAGGAPREKPHGDPLRRDVPPQEKRDWRERPPKQNREWQDRPPQQKRAWQDRPPAKREWTDRPPRRSADGPKAGPPREKPHGDPLRRDVPPRGVGGSGRPKPWRSDRPPGASGPRSSQKGPGSGPWKPRGGGGRGPAKPRGGRGGGGR